MVELPESIRAVRETLSRQAHDIWAAKRIADEWTYGETRDDKKKTHPDLVAYEELADRDKAYDRDLIDGTILLLIKLGFRIERDTGESASSGGGHRIADA
ncbi:MAG TPA: RyR domain-containing protein [Actinoplanes sp.]|nr:RyR domain-containing protein [Actinoplanes sp.]